MDPQPETVSYICGDCGQENPRKPGEVKPGEVKTDKVKPGEVIGVVIKCDCGHRIFYKKRTRRIIQYEAR